MRTTLKRGLGRGAAPNGNGKAVSPPGLDVARDLLPAAGARAALAHAPDRADRDVARDRVPRLRDAGTDGRRVPLLPRVGRRGRGEDARGASKAAQASSTSRSRVSPRSRSSSATTRARGTGTNGRPLRHAHARAGRPSDRLDLVALVPTRHERRDPVPGQDAVHGQDQRGVRYCGPQGSLQTVRALTGVQINYLITVNFRGFRQIVDRLGGAWIDVDRRYFNDRGGPGGYARINLFPGYQRLDGRKTLDYVRFRHTDSDLYRVARQQQFVKAFKGQIQESFAPTAAAEGRQRDHAQRRGRRRAEATTSSGRTVLSYALFAYGLPQGRVFQTRIEGLRASTDLTTAQSNITSAVATFSHPGRRLVGEGDGRRARREARRQAPPPTRDEHHRAERQRGRGLRLDGGLPPRPALLRRAHAAERPPGERADVRLLPDEGLLRPGAQGRQRGGPEGHQPLRVRRARAAASQALAARERGDATVVVGQTFHGSLASAPVDQTPKRERPNVTYGPNASLDLLRARRTRVPFPLMVPTVIERSSWTDSTMPVRLYCIDPGGSTRPCASSTTCPRTSTGASR